MKVIERGMDPGDRYRFDYGRCGSSNGWAQIDTGQDASYFGTWINPTLRKIFTFCEGDTTEVTVDDDYELVAEIERMKQWADDNGCGFLGIDPGFNEDLKKKLEQVGLASYCH